MSQINFTELLGSSLRNQSAEVATSTLTTSGKKVIGLYFSASWCYPCKLFSPMLREFYTAKGSNLEIVLVSLDQDEQAHIGYYETMPWLSTVYNLETNRSIAKSLGVQRIPALHFFDTQDGSLITKDASSSIEKDPKGVFFPYRSKTLRSVLAESKLVDHAGNSVENSLLHGKNLAIFFDTTTFEKEWWAGCRGDCGVDMQYGDKFACLDCSGYNLCEACHEKVGELHNQEGHEFEKVVTEDSETLVKTTRSALIAKYSYKPEDFEVVMISRAKTAEEHAQHAALVPWPVVAFDETHSAEFHVSGIFDLFWATGISKIVVVDAARNIVNKDASFALNNGADIPFKNHKVGDLSKTMFADGLQQGDKPFMVIYGSTATPQELENIKSVLHAVAERVSPSGATDPTAGKVVCNDDVCQLVPDTAVAEPRMLFFYESTKSDSGRNLRGWSAKEFEGSRGRETKPDLLIASYSPPNIFYYSGEITEDVLVHLSEDFLSGKLVKEREERREAAEAAAKADQEKVDGEIGIGAESETTVSNEKAEEIAKAASWSKTTTTATTKVDGKVTKTTTQTVYKRSA
ncbi:UNVERIFIED_CONTAM: hypothetical protein HDU68_010325 [Siphonaria sp. JEL0065]|nr:hypothetical protein HDU68_010325 [Siphonaria sp. JEL0065]